MQGAEPRRFKLCDLGGTDQVRAHQHGDECHHDKIKVAEGAIYGHQ